MTISVTGLDFRTAPVDVREQLALDGQQCLKALRLLGGQGVHREAMILSTCNRTEFYLVGPPAGEVLLPRLIDCIQQVRGAACPADASMFYRHEGPQAVEHLLAVCSSLKSQVVGEHEVLGQVKEAYRLACQAGAAGFLLHKLLHRGFRTGKRVMTETRLGEGTASVSQAAVDLARCVLGDLRGRSALLVGAGQTAELVAQALMREGVGRLVVANRTHQRAGALAETFRKWHWQRGKKLSAPAGDGPAGTAGVTCPALAQLTADSSAGAPAASDSAAAGQVAAAPVAEELSIRAVGLDQLPEAVASADLVICSTGADSPVLTVANVGAVLKGRPRAILLIDIAVPRDVDAELGKLPNVFLYNIDCLRAQVELNLSRRAEQVAAARKIVREEADDFNAYLASLQAAPTIQQLRQRIQQLRQEELRRLAGRCGDSERQLLEAFSQSLCNKLLHAPTAYLREMSASGQADPAVVDMLRRVFDLPAGGDEQ